MKIGALLRTTAIAASVIAVLGACSSGGAAPAASTGDKNAVLQYWLWQDDATDTTWAATM